MSQTDQQFFDTLARFARDRGGGGSTVQQSLEATKLHAFCAKTPRRQELISVGQPLQITS